jgi:hypothetical protein
MKWWRRLWARKDKTPRILMEPGQTLVLVDKTGVIRGKVILSQVSFDRENGTQVYFEDYSRYLQKAAGRWGW